MRQSFNNNNIVFETDICHHCNQDRQFSNTCKCKPVLYNGKTYLPIRFGDEKYRDFSSYKRCIDCNVEKGGYHHAGCEIEECPVCHKPILICDC